MIASKYGFIKLFLIVLLCHIELYVIKIGNPSSLIDGDDDTKFNFLFKEEDEAYDKHRNKKDATLHNSQSSSKAGMGNIRPAGRVRLVKRF